MMFSDIRSDVKNSQVMMMMIRLLGVLFFYVIGSKGNLTCVSHHGFDVRVWCRWWVGSGGGGILYVIAHAT